MINNKNGINIGYVNADGVDIDESEDIFGNIEDAVADWMGENDVKCGEDGHVNLVKCLDGLIWEFKKEKMLQESLEYNYKEVKKEKPEYTEEEIDEEIIDRVKHMLCLIK